MGWPEDSKTPTDLRSLRLQEQQLRGAIKGAKNSTSNLIDRHRSMVQVIQIREWQQEEGRLSPLEELLERVDDSYCAPSIRVAAAEVRKLLLDE